MRCGIIWATQACVAPNVCELHAPIASYCMALWSYLNLLFLTAISLFYYNQWSKVKED
jgi:hypothetical protein